MDTYNCGASTSASPSSMVSLLNSLNNSRYRRVAVLSMKVEK